MKIRTLESPQPERSRAEAQAAQFNLRSAWLRQLERAQLQGWFGDRVTPGADTAQTRDSDHPSAARTRSALPDASEPASSAVSLSAGDTGGFTPLEAGHSAPKEGNRGEGARETSDAPKAPARTPAGPPEEHALVLPSPTPEPEPAGGADCPRGPEIRQPEKTADAKAPDRAAPPVPHKPWPARSVHMMSDGSRASVWIRDNALAQGSTGAILSSLAGELRLRGLRLHALTVNGRVAFEAEPAPGSGKASRSTFTKEVNRHGND